MNYTIIVTGHPKAQPRPRASRIGGHARVYNPTTAKGWKQSIAEAARAQRPDMPISGPVRVSATFTFPRPQRLMRKSSPDGLLWHTAKPDRDNLDKAVLDALTDDGWFCDDAQVCAGELLKFYAGKGEEPGVRITIEELPC